MDENSTDYLLSDIGAPFVIGLAVGFFAKKALKVALFLGGMVIVALFVTEYYGIADVNDESLKQAANAATDAARQSGGFLSDRLGNITGKGVSATVGFLAGLKMG